MKLMKCFNQWSRSKRWSFLFGFLLLFVGSFILLGIKDINADSTEDFYIDSQGILIKYSGVATDVVVPEGVVEINHMVFYESDITSITFPSTLKSIGWQAFRYCKSLKTITFNEGLEVIDEQAFAGCSSLGEIVLPDSLTSIGKNAFLFCRGLKSVVLPKYLQNLGVGVFCDSGVETITWPENLKSIGVSAFHGTAFTELTLPKGLEKIDYEAFSECSKLTMITIPASVTEIAPDAFLDCKSLTTIKVNSKNTVYCNYRGALYDKAKETLICYPVGKTTLELPTTLKSIGGYAFAYCKLDSIIVPEGVRLIDEYAFYYADLEEISLPSTLRSIGKGVFYRTYIEKLELPSNLSEIKLGAFNGMHNLTSFAVASDNTHFRTSLNGLYTKDLQTLIAYPGALTTATLAKQTVEIADYAFYWSNIKEVKLNNNLKKIGDHAFYCCGIENIIMPDSVEQIGSWCFTYSKSLQEVQLSASLHEIPYAAFASTGIKELEIPDSVISIGKDAFAYSRLEKVKLPKYLATIGEYAFEGTLITKITIPGSLKVISSNAFQGSSLEEVVLEEGIEEIDAWAFMCRRLKSIILPQSMKKVNWAFNETHMEWILVPEGLEDLRVSESTIVYGVKGSEAEKICLKRNYQFIAVVYPFIDIYPGNWYENVVRYMTDHKYILGTSKVTFSPTETMTRGQLITILWRLEGSPKTVYEDAFSDVTADRYCALALQWAKNMGLACGMNDGSFHPDEGVTREQFMTFLYRYAKYKKYDMKVSSETSYQSVSDYSTVSSFAITSMNWAYEKGFIAANGKFNAKGRTVRIEAAAMLMRFIQYFEK